MFKYLEKKIENKYKNPISIGTEPVYNKEDIDFILKSNLITIYCVILFAVASIYYLIIAEKLDASIYIVGTILVLVSHYINNIKYLYFIKFALIFVLNLAILLLCVIYKRSELYVFCFFIVIYLSNILFSYKKLVYIIILSIESILFIFFVHFYNGIVIMQPELEKNIISNFVFQIILFSGINEIAAKINYFKDIEYLKDKAKLFKINKTLKKTNTEIDQLNVAALHSMKTPLYVADDFIKQLHENTIQQKVNFDREEYVTLINNSIQLSEMYVKKLITYDAIVTNSITYEYFNVLEKIKFVSEIVMKKSSNVSISINCEDFCEDFMVHTNEFCFLVVIENLITNGLKYNSCEMKEITIDAQKNRYETVIKITDNGIGIEPAFYDRIFDPFVRLNHNLLVDGTGLGLSSVKVAATKINGNVKVLQSSIRGTTFEFKFKNN